MKHLFLLLILISGSFYSCTNSIDQEAEIWLTVPSKDILFQQQENIVLSQNPNLEPTILIDDQMRFQEIEGFGFTLSQGSAMHLLGMDKDKRKELLLELFGDGKSDIGISYLRLSIAASDLNGTVFSYHDLEEDESDPELTNFDLGPDREDVIPILKEILEINPNITLMASPWSPPAWMKDNNDTRGGSLLPENYGTYALYFVKYIQQMKEEGIHIDAITVQNEPLHPGNNPSLLMLAEEQRDFVKNHLGPKFEEYELGTKIILYDHNADRPDYPITILDDPEAKKYIHGSAFHLYGGEIEALSEVHQAHPDKHIYFTEQWIGAPGNLAGDLVWHTKNLTIGATRNWARTVLEWNLTSNPELTPFTDRGGCSRCLGAVTIDGNEVTRNPAYYIIAHASKFVLPGSIRIDSNIPDNIPNVAFLRPDGKIVVLILNESKEEKDFSIQTREYVTQLTLAGGAVATVIVD
ncbi:glycoside hydrolase family 30 protein [Arthrospiribacter ruber]|uniref:Glucosylceramidase n=1 Tax=Arthrospiribacter ruber TaxID=2487934 RepID=A0A951IY89_9BACT|nr:glycoside hydrolase family 30 beta sandwich domain-containing protein [Arthrospiribacter ruber]MBW3468272.1 glucosylceramidase [Arthrospiribacter ruber]